MNDKHITASELDLYVENELTAPARAEMEAHLATCATCRAQVAFDQEMSRALRVLPRQEPPRDLAARIDSAVQVRVAQDQLRRARMPFIFAATVFSALLLVWFGFQLAVAFQVNGTFDFVSLLTSRPDIFSTDSIDAIWALIDAVPIGEIVLTLFALFTVIVLAQQWVETIRPPSSHSGYTHAH